MTCGGCGGPLRLHHSVSQAKFDTYGPGARLRKRPVAGPHALLATKRARRRLGGWGGEALASRRVGLSVGEMTRGVIQNTHCQCAFNSASRHPMSLPAVDFR